MYYMCITAPNFLAEIPCVQTLALTTILKYESCSSQVCPKSIADMFATLTSRYVGNYSFRVKRGTCYVNNNLLVVDVGDNTITMTQVWFSLHTNQKEDVCL